MGEGWYTPVVSYTPQSQSYRGSSGKFPTYTLLCSHLLENTCSYPLPQQQARKQKEQATWDNQSSTGITVQRFCTENSTHTLPLAIRYVDTGTYLADRWSQIQDDYISERGKLEVSPELITEINELADRMKEAFLARHSYDPSPGYY